MISGAPDEFRLIADSAPVPMWLTGLDRTRRFVNRAYLDFLNVGYDEGRTFDWRSILHPDDHDRILVESIAGEASLKPFTLEACYRRHDNEWRWLRSVSQPSFDAQGVHNGFVGIVVDLTDLREGDKALKTRERKLSAYVNQSSAGFAEVDPSGRIVEVNDRYCEITGYSREQLLGRSMQSITHPEDLPRNLPLFAAAVSHGTPFSIEKRYVRPDRSVVWVNNSVSVITGNDSNLTGILAVSIDITARRLVEENLRDAEERLRMATEAAGIGAWEWDLKALRGTWSDQTSRILGVAGGVGVSARDHSQAIHPDDRKGALAAASEGIARNGRFTAEYRIVRPDGATRWVEARGLAIPDASGTPLRTIGTLRDITEARANRERLENLNRELESQVAQRTAERDGMWRLSRDLMIVLDPRLRMLAVNPVCAELTGYTADEVTGHTFKRFIHPEDWPTAIAAIRAGRRAPVREVEARLIHRDGSLREFVWSASPEAGRAYVSGRDVSEERARQRALFEAQEALRQAQKLDAIGQLTGGVAHDFNNLLSPIIGTLDLLKKRETGEERTTRMIDAAQQSAERARLLVQRLLTFARRQPLQLQPVDLAALVVGLRDLIHSTLGPEIALGIEIAGAVPPVTADPGQLETAILNLAANARDAMQATGQEGRRLTVLLAPDEADDTAQFVVLAVTDNGVGMDEATLARSTDPFFSGKGVGRGSGLGLSMVDGLTAQLGGTMTIESEPGVGTTVLLRLPASPEHIAARVLGPVEEVMDCEACHHVLLVEDEPLVRMATAELLRDSGFEVTEAASAEVALALFEAGDSFDCVVTDHLMPGITGVELARILRASHPDLPVMLLSGYAELDSFGSELPFMSKPYRADDLVAKVSALAGRKSLPTVN